MPQMVGAELHLKAIHGAAVRNRHHAGVVAQYIETLMLLVKGVGERTDRGYLGEIEFHHADLRSSMRGADCGGGGAPPLHATAGEHHHRPLARELERGFVADTAVAAGNDNGFSGQIRQILSGPCLWIGHIEYPCSSPLEESVLRKDH